MDYIGYESEYAPTGTADSSTKSDKPNTKPFKASPNINRTTATPSQSNETKEEQKISKQQFAKSSESNILNSYRSVTYNFTLAALKKSAVKDPTAWEASERELTILRSGGKGTTGFGTNVQGTSIVITDPEAGTRTESDTVTGTELVQGFNKESPGRFDLFIENVEIETLMTFDQKANNTLPTKITFDVIEPFSVNGFIEALHVSAVAAGYVNYTQASYILKMEFQGYPDNQSLPSPEVVPQSTRYFVFGFTGVEVDISERGTRYKCTAVPFNEKAFGQPNVLIKPIKMAGVTVGEILDNFMAELNVQVKQNTDATSVANNDYDEYEVKFPVWDENEGWVDGQRGGRRNLIAQERLTELYRDNVLYNMSDPGKNANNAYKAALDQRQKPADQIKQPEAVKYQPNSTVVQFAEKMTINDAITAVVRDSEYTRKILKEGKIDPETGMIKYFMVRMEVVNKDTKRINELTKKPAQKYTFVVTEYETHYTRIPGFGSNRVDEKKIKKIALREYNYIYTGLNVDITNFKLNFNTLFFEALPAAMGNKDVPQAKVGAANNNEPNIKIKSCVGVNQLVKNEIGDAPVKVNPDATSVVRPNQPNAGQILNSPYDTLAKNMHEAITDSKASMIVGEIEILGDPLYLVTGGIGNYNPKPSSRGKSLSGEALFLFGDVLIAINFRNPIDIRPAEEGGTMFFDPKRAPFSGVYRVTKAVSTFREGQFKQRLEIMRVPGQIIDDESKECDPSINGILKPVPSPINQIIPDTTRGAPSLEQRPSESALQQIARENVATSNRVIPQQGQLGGVTVPQVDTRTYGLVNRAGQLISNANPIGRPITDISQNIRLNTSGLFSSGVLSQPALVAAAVSIISKDRSAKQVASVIAGGLIKETIANSGKIFTKGSGIGEGKTISVTDNLSPPNVENLISNTTAGIQQFGSSMVDKISSIPDNISSTVSGIGDKINNLLGSKSDPEGLGAKIGIDINKFSGLGGNLSSKFLDAAKNIEKLKPENVDLKQSLDLGVQLDFLPPSAVQNLPATMPFTKALPSINKADEDYIQNVVAKKGPGALTDLFGVTDVSKISGNTISPSIIKSALANVPPQTFNPLANVRQFNPVDISSVAGKLSSAKDQIGNIVPSVNIPDLNVKNSVTGLFGSVQDQTSPLKKLLTNLNNTNLPPNEII